MGYWPVLLALLGACEADFSRVAVDCRTELDSIGPDASANVAAALLEQHCAETLGNSVALDWGSFGFDSNTPLSSPVGAYVLVGLLSVAGGGSMTLESLEDDPDLPPVARDGLKDIAIANDYDENTRSDEAWYEWIRTAVAGIVHGVDTGVAAASYDSQTGVLTVNDAFVGEALASAWPPAVAGGMLVHEATHRLSSHTDCPDGSGANCDQTPDGAYGVEVWWLSRWQALSGVDRAGQTCRDIDAVKVVICEAMIVDATGWPPCESSCG